MSSFAEDPNPLAIRGRRAPPCGRLKRRECDRSRSECPRPEREVDVLAVEEVSRSKPSGVKQCAFDHMRQPIRPAPRERSAGRTAGSPSGSPTAVASTPSTARPRSKRSSTAWAGPGRHDRRRLRRRERATRVDAVPGVFWQSHHCPTTSPTGRVSGFSSSRYRSRSHPAARFTALPQPTFLERRAGRRETRRRSHRRNRRGSVVDAEPRRVWEWHRAERSAGRGGHRKTWWSRVL
jgi:hypothetical protein